jgi:hypothetical protein
MDLDFLAVDVSWQTKLLHERTCYAKGNLILQTKTQIIPENISIFSFTSSSDCCARINNSCTLLRLALERFSGAPRPLSGRWLNHAAILTTKAQRRVPRTQVREPDWTVRTGGAGSGSIESTQSTQLKSPCMSQTQFQCYRVCIRHIVRYHGLHRIKRVMNSTTAGRSC